MPQVETSAIEVVARIHEPPALQSTSRPEKPHPKASSLSAAARLEVYLHTLREELEDEDGEAGSVSFFGIGLLKVVLARSRRGQASWILLSFLLASAELLAVLAVAVGVHFRKCLYDDDCKTGTVCAFLHDRRHGWLNQALCFDCQGFTTQVVMEVW